MKKQIKPKPISIWRLVHLGQELDEIAVRLSLLATSLKHGLADHALYEAKRQRPKDRPH